jgi:hypothetical protein
MATGSHVTTERVSLVSSVRARQIMHAYTPRKWKVVQGGVHQGGASGLCEYCEKTIYVPYVCDTFSLYVFLHEVGHAKLHRFSKNPTHVDEYEAEMFAHKALRECGFSVPRYATQSAKRYVWEEILKDRMKGLPIDPKIERWASRHPQVVA